MTEDQIALLQESFAVATRRSNELMDAFYSNLFHAAPELRTMFPIDLTVQKRKLGTALSATVRFVDQPSVIAPELRALGARHDRYGVRDEHYTVVGAALVGALAHVLGDAFTAEVRRAWVDAFAFIKATMLEGVVTERTVTLV